MKRLLAILLIVIVAALIFCVPVLANLPHVPHEDPATAESSIDVRSLLWYYGDVLEMVSLGEYERAEGLIQGLEYANIPEDYKDIVDRYSDLACELLTTLDNLDEALGEASSLLEQYRIDEAAVRLGEARVLFDQVESILSDIEEEGIEELSSHLGVFDTPAGSLEREAYGSLHAVIDMVEELIDESQSLLESLSGESAAIEEKELQPTTITLQLSPAAAFVGETITAKGSLTSEEEPLPNRSITMLLDGEPVATATAGSSGSFEVQVSIPFEYVLTMTVEALYVPGDDDRDKYLAAISPSQEVGVKFYQTDLEIEAPDEAYPGLPVVVSGEIAWEGGEAADGRNVKVLLDDGLLATLSVQEERFDVEVTPEPGISVGEHTLTVTVDPQGRYAGVSKGTLLNIVRMLPEVDVDAPTFTLIPSTIHVRGKVHSPLPLEGARVSVEMGDASTEVETLEEGEFSAKLSMGLDLVFVGLEELVVKVEPVEPWHGPVEVKVRVFVINLTNVGLTVVAAAVLGVLLVTKRRGRTGKEEAPPLDAPLVVERRTEAAPVAKPAVKFEGIKGRLLEAYLRAAVVVEEATRVRMEPHMTLREFMREATPRMHSAFEAFARLTALAERALYSSHVPEAEEAAEAEKLTLEVEEVLKGGLA